MRKILLTIVLVLVAANSYAFNFASFDFVGGNRKAGPDITPPSLSTATIGTNGTTWNLLFSEIVSIGAGGNAGWSGTMSTAGTITLSYVSGSGTNTLVYTGSPSVNLGDTGTIAYTQPGNGVEDVSGNDLATIASASVTNSSTQVASYDYCVRQDGVATLINATDCSAASTSMSPATFNSSSFSAGQTVVFSGRGGDITTNITIPSGGSSGNPIYYKGEAGHTPTFAGAATEGAVKVSSKNYLELHDMIAKNNNSPFLFEGTSTGIVTYNLVSNDSTNQGYQHLNTVSVTHNNLTATGALDEGVSLHDTCTVVINGATITNCVNGFNWVGSQNLTVRDFVITGVASTGKSIDGVTASGGTYIFDRFYIEEHPDQAGRVIDCTAGTWTFKNGVFKNLTDGDYYLLARTSVAGHSVINCTFIGDGTNTTTAIFNQYTGFVGKNNIFHNVVTQAYYGTSGTLAYNLYNNSGTARGTNTVTGDPLLTATGRLSAGSPAINTGIGPGSDAAIPTYDIDGDTRSGATTDIGADEY